MQREGMRLYPATAQDAHAMASVSGELLNVTIEIASKPRTLTQNNCIHLYLSRLADALNDAGFDMRKTVREEIDIPWNAERAKDVMWRGIQEAMFNTRSTTDLSTVQAQEVYQVLDRHIASKTGVSVPWPSIDSMREETRNG